MSEKTVKKEGKAYEGERGRQGDTVKELKGR